MAACSRTSDPLAQCTRQELADRIEAAIESLTDTSREVFVLIRVEGLSYRETAELLQIPIGTVQSRLAYATRALRQRLADEVAEASGSELPSPLSPTKEIPDALR
jgi:RNA polymerase sigma-70 factor (ECF subfamily)